MVVRPDSPVDEWFKDYEWMNEEENFEEEFLDSLHIEELNKVAQAIDDELVEAEVSQNLNTMMLSSGGDSNSNMNNSPNDNHENILISSKLNPNAAEFVPSFSVSR